MVDQNCDAADCKSPPALEFDGLLNEFASPFMDYVDVPESALQQAAIDAMKPERDREEARAMAAQMKLHRQREATQEP